MMQHQLLTIDQYPSAWGDVGVTIATPRGVFTGWVDQRRLQSLFGVRQADLPDCVDTWHPVPRWMRPSEVLRTIES